MINVSDEFKELMNTLTGFKEYAEVTFTDGTVLELEPTDFCVGGNAYNDAAGDSMLPVGVAISRNIQIELMNDDEHLSGYDFFGASIRLYLAFELSETTEKIELGTFTVVEPETYGEIVVVTANDDMYKADKAFSTSLTYPVTAQKLLLEVCDTCGIQLYSTSFNNDAFTIAEAPSSDLTFRQVIGYIAMLAGGNARIRRTGGLEIIPYSFDYDGGSLHDLKYWNSLTVDTSDITITGVQTTREIEVEDEDGNTTTADETILNGEEGYVLDFENPLIAWYEEDFLAYMATVFVGKSMRRFEGQYIAYPLAEFMDLAQITDRKGRVYYSVLTDINFSFFSFTTFKNSTQSAFDNASIYETPENSVLIAARKLVEKEATARELAVDYLNTLLENSSGMYVTEEVQADGSVIQYLHDKPTLAESSNVIKITSDAIGFSTDGGVTYPYGVTIDGDTIMKIIYAEGINADYVQIGSTSVSTIISSIQSSLDGTNQELADFAEAVTGSLENLQAQIDGQIETWYYDYAPTLENYPASEWTTDDEKAAHEGDLFYDKSTGYCYRFFNNDGTWEWTLIQDTDITTAIAAAAEAQDTADEKRRVFVVTPTPPYDEGDLWTDGTDIWTCTTARASGIFSADDWEVLNNYVDKVTVSTLQTSLNVVQGQIEAKVWMSDITEATDEVRKDSIYSFGVQFAQGDSATEAPESGWSQQSPEWVDGLYVWMRTFTLYGPEGDDGIYESDPVCLSGATGADGVGIVSYTPLYYCSDSAIAPAAPTAHVDTNDASVYGAWNLALPAWTETYRYYYTCAEIIYSDGTYSWGAVIADNSLVAITETIQTIHDQYAEIVTELDSITLKVGDVETTLSSLDDSVVSLTEQVSELTLTAEGLTSTVTSLSSDMTTVQGSISTLQQTADSLTLAVENISVGGTNLLLGTATEQTITPNGNTNNTAYLYALSSHYLDNLPEKGDEVVLSFDWESTATTGTFRPQFNAAEIGTVWDVPGSKTITLSSSNQSGHYSIKGSYTSAANGAATRVGIRFDGADGTFTTRNWKFEKGTTATDWSPAPEDMASKAELALTIGSDGVATLSAYADAIKFTSNTISISSTYFTLTSTGVLTATSATLTGTMTTTSGNYKTVLTSGGLYQYYNNTLYGYYSSVYASSTSYGLSMRLQSSAMYWGLAIGTDSAGYGFKYVLNNGANPNGFTETHIFYGYIRAYNSIYLSYNSTSGIYTSLADGSTAYRIFSSDSSSYVYIGNNSHTTVYYGSPLYINDNSHVTHIRGSSIYLYGHSTAIGTVTSASASSVSSSSGSWKALTSISLAAGSWVIVGTAYSSSGSYTAALCINTTSAASTTANGSAAYSSSNTQRHTTVYPVNISSATTYYLNFYASASVTVTSATLYAMRIT